MEKAPHIDEIIILSVHRVPTLADAVDHQRVRQVSEIDDLPQRRDTTDLKGGINTPSSFLHHRFAPIGFKRPSVEDILNYANT